MPDKKPCEICGVAIRSDARYAIALKGQDVPVGRVHYKCLEARGLTAWPTPADVQQLAEATARMQAHFAATSLERGKLLVKMKEMAREFKAGNCNRGLVWATACAMIQQCERIGKHEKQQWLARWDRLAGFAV